MSAPLPMFLNSGLVSIQGASLNFDALSAGDAMFTVEQGGTYESDVGISGTVYASSSIVGDGFAGSYVNPDSFIGTDAGIDLQPASVMYDVALVPNAAGTGEDILATMKSFDQVLGASAASPAASLAPYLDANHDLMLGSSIFTQLNASPTLAALDANIINQFGLDLIPNFAKQNLDVLKSANARANASLFDTPVSDDNVRAMAGYDFFGRERDDWNGLTGYKDQAHSLFLMGDKAYDNTFRYGLGMSLSYLNSDYNNKDKRKEVIVQVFAPLTTKFNDTLSLITTPRLGVGFGDYRRRVDDVVYRADTQNYYYGVSNELRKDIDVGMFTLQPTAELNALGIYQDTMKENGGIEAKPGNNVSVEGGLGLYAKKTFELSEEDALKFRVGGGYYHEFNDTFSGVKASMAGMAGSYHMQRYATDRDRGVLSVAASWRHKMMNFYLQLSQFIERSNATQIDAGVRYDFK